MTRAPGSTSDRAVARLDELYARFGRVVLLPIPFGTKWPVMSEWQTISFPTTQTREYRANILSQIRKGGNIGVVQGNGLVAIDFDRDDLAVEFKRLNRATLATKGQKGCQFWYRVKPGYPNGQDYYTLANASGKKCGEWRCGPGSQSIAYGQHPEGPRYRFLEDKPIAEIAFEDIRWPEGIIPPAQNGSAHVNESAPQEAPNKSEYPDDAVLERETSASSANSAGEEKPKILAPADNRLDSAFAAELGDILAGSEFYRYNGECMVIDSAEDQIRPALRKVEPEEFITLIEKHCTPISRKQIEKADGKKTTIEVEKSISLKVARVTLVSPDFLSRLKPIRGFNSVRMPIDVGGKAVLASPGYDASTRTFTATDGPEINERLPLPEAVSYESEMRKVIATAAHESAPVLFLDNVKNHLSGPSLEALATSAVFTGRILGETKGIEKENRITVIITGNGCTFSPDLRRRVLAVELFLKEAKAEDRAIKNPLDDERILALRPQILSALWALVREWDKAGRTAR